MTSNNQSNLWNIEDDNDEDISLDTTSYTLSTQTEYLLGFLIDFNFQFNPLIFFKDDDPNELETLVIDQSTPKIEELSTLGKETSSKTQEQLDLKEISKIPWKRMYILAKPEWWLISIGTCLFFQLIFN